MPVNVTKESLLEATIVELGDALYSILNLQSVAEVGNEEMGAELDVPYHFDKVRSALKTLADRFPDLDREALA